MTLKTKLKIAFATSLLIFLVFGMTQATFESYLFDQIPYNYTSYVSIPSNSANENPISGYYKIYGHGNNFNFEIKLPGAEDNEDPLCYTKDGLNGTGKINKIDITYNTIISLVNGKFKEALFNTKFNGEFNMNCAAWTGYGNFSNDGQNFPGKFKINGPMTDWEGTFHVIQANNRIILKADYIMYPNNNRNYNNVVKVNKTYYM